MGKTKGRPKGSSNVKVVTQWEPPRCKNCQSTRFRRIGRRKISDVTDGRLATADGEPYNVVVRQKVQCLDCDEPRVNRSLEYHPDGVVYGDAQDDQNEGEET